jgi:hypothetical protein
LRRFSTAIPRRDSVSDSSSPPRESLIRAAYPAVEFRDATDDELAAGHLGLLRVLFSPVNEWTEINSMWEGQFMERFAPGAWKKTIADQRDRMKVAVPARHGPAGRGQAARPDHPISRRPTAAAMARSRCWTPPTTAICSPD